MQWWGYSWTVAVNCIVLFVVGYVFDRLNSRPQIVTVAILGLIYVTIRTIAIGQLIMSLTLFTDVNRQLLYMRSLLKDPTYQENQKAWDEVEKSKPQKLNKFYIDLGFLSLIGLFCLFVLFNAIG